MTTKPHTQFNILSENIQKKLGKDFYKVPGSSHFEILLKKRKRTKNIIDVCLLENENYCEFSFGIRIKEAEEVAMTLSNFFLNKFKEV
jgi:hypothetical protein